MHQKLRQEIEKQAKLGGSLTLAALSRISNYTSKLGAPDFIEKEDYGIYATRIPFSTPFIPHSPVSNKSTLSPMAMTPSIPLQSPRAESKKGIEGEVSAASCISSSPSSKGKHEDAAPIRNVEGFTSATSDAMIIGLLQEIQSRTQRSFEYLGGLVLQAQAQAQAQAQTHSICEADYPLLDGLPSKRTAAAEEVSKEDSAPGDAALLRAELPLTLPLLYPSTGVVQSATES